MAKFAQFLMEVGFSMPFGGQTRHSGIFDLPDIINVHKPGTVPAGGYQSLGQFAQSKLDYLRYSDADTYVLRLTIQNIIALAENIGAAVLMHQQQLQQTNNMTHRLKYPDATISRDRRVIDGVHELEIVGGEYPHLRREDFQRGIDLGIISLNGNTAKNGDPLYRMNIDKLREEADKLAEKIYTRERGLQAANWAIGQGDDAFNRMTTGSMIPSKKSINALNGG